MVGVSLSYHQKEELEVPITPQRKSIGKKNQRSYLKFYLTSLWIVCLLHHLQYFLNSNLLVCLWGFLVVM